MILNEAQANQVWNILVATCGAREDMRPDFLFHAQQTRRLEFRFQGSLGFGGKVYIEEPPRVTCYREHETTERNAAIATANEKLNFLWGDWGANEMSSNKRIVAGAVVSVVSLIVIAGSFTIVPSCIDNATAQKLCRRWRMQILREAKAEPPKVGLYEGSLDATDPWDNQLHSNLTVEELANSAVVSSAGKDGTFGTKDDITSRGIDVHIRKSIAKGIEGGAHSFGKGLTRGVIEGAGESSEIHSGDC